ncbi:uncharacterized protein LOC129229544 [Uloborus diversus]|uniref:uncharacterized protein LOC129229544 n=1 Tax=Uloborus diversus TaxID=327109 RepID=UPI00240A4BB8|nr:uncharacterized protein LOC129229544 [Uloborus diversus]
MMSSKVVLLQGVILILFATSQVKGRIRRCYVCRSRGELGDCKDPFQYNSTTVEDLRGVEAAPCASGWCAKIIEGENSDFDTATERMCVQRPPTDGEERCSDTIFDRKPVYMCFCLGDLCNGVSIPGSISHQLLFLCSAFVFILARRQLMA